MLKLKDGILELLKKVATSLPRDVEDSLKRAFDNEGEGPAREALLNILENVKMARASSKPICQDTGTPVFYVTAPRELAFGSLQEQLLSAVKEATQSVPLRANAVDSLTDKNSCDNTGREFPEINFRQSADNTLLVDLSLRGAGCENAGAFYRLPEQSLKAGRDLDGVRACVLDAVHRVQGRACPPYIVGVGIAGTRLTAAKISREALLRRLDEDSPVEILRSLEHRLVSDINSLGIGPLGLGGKATALGVKIDYAHRHTASYFVDVSFSCWATRRGRLLW
jgi:fumarate hydratase class I